MNPLKKKKNNRLYSDFNIILFSLFIFFLPTQLGKHFFPPYSYLNGVRVDYLSPTLYLTDIFVFFLFIFNLKTVINFFKNKKVLVGLVLLLINASLAINKPVAFYQLVKIIEWLVVFSLGRDLLKIIREKILLFILFLSAGLELVLAVSQMILKHSLQGFAYWFGERLFTLSTPGIAKATIQGIEFLRPYGTFSHPNSLAGYFLLLYFFVLAAKKFNKYLVWKYLLLFVFSCLIFISFSKAAILTYLILNTLYFMLNAKTACRICKIARVTVPIIISLIFLQATTDPLTVDKRLGLIKNSLTIIFQHPVFGVGLGNYLVAQSAFASKYFLFFNQPVHNIFLLFITETGIMTAGMVAYFLLKPVYLIFKENPYVILVVIFTGLFDHYWLTLPQTWLVLALIYGSVSSAFFVSRLSLRS